MYQNLIFAELEPSYYAGLLRRGQCWAPGSATLICAEKTRFCTVIQQTPPR